MKEVWCYIDVVHTKDSETMMRLLSLISPSVNTIQLIPLITVHFCSLTSCKLGQANKRDSKRASDFVVFKVCELCAVCCNVSDVVR